MKLIGLLLTILIAAGCNFGHKGLCEDRPEVCEAVKPDTMVLPIDGGVDVIMVASDAAVVDASTDAPVSAADAASVDVMVFDASPPDARVIPPGSIAIGLNIGPSRSGTVHFLHTDSTGAYVDQNMSIGGFIQIDDLPRVQACSSWPDLDVDIYGGLLIGVHLETDETGPVDIWVGCDPRYPDFSQVVVSIDTDVSDGIELIQVPMERYDRQNNPAPGFTYECDPGYWVAIDVPGVYDPYGCSP